jgi:hypothetical protein
MRTTIAIATFLAVGAGAVGVSALDLKGSDTIKDITIALLTNNALDCGGVGNTPVGTLVYIGTGSGNGQSAMLGTATQQIAPMSSRMTTAVCNDAGHANGANAEGIVFALDGLSIVADDGFAACTGGATCGSGGGMIDWQNTLRLLYFGLDSSSDLTRDCGGTARTTLVNNWNNIFTAACANSGNCPAGIQHAFRRNDESGTTDTFQGLVGVASAIRLSLVNVTSSFCNSGTTGAIGGVKPAFTTLQTLPTRPGANTDFIASHVTVLPPGNTAATYKGEYFPDLQDMDPIRRVCVFSATVREDVCSARGDLGVVLPIWDAPFSTLPTNQFAVDACTTGKYRCDAAILETTNGVTPPVYQPCPNGHNPITIGTCPVGQCATPVRQVSATVLDPRCYADRNQQAPGDLPAPKNIYDGRVHNLTSWFSNSGNVPFFKARVPRVTGDPSFPIANVAMVGAFYRLHSIRSIVQPNITCKAVNATDQIGCLVQASPCSIGFAGNSAVIPGTVALNANGSPPADACVQNGTYPLRGKLYLNTIDGFGAITPDQYRLARCDQRQLELPGDDN